MKVLLATLLTLAGRGAAQTTLKEARPYGILLLSPDGGKAWADSAAALRRALPKDFPVADAVGMDAKAIQKAVDGLEDRRVLKIVAVPVYLSSYSAEMDELRYLFGIRKDPAAAYFASSHLHAGQALVKRVKFKAPVVLTAALDDAPSFSDLLAARAAKSSKKPSAESLVIVAKAPAGDEKNSQWQGTLNALAEMARRKANMAYVQTYFLPQDAGQAERETAASEFKKLIRTLKRRGPVIVVALALTGGDLLKDLTRALDGTFVRYEASALLPDARLTAWAQQSAQAGAALPDMRTFKDEGRAIPKESVFHHLGGNR